MYLVKNIQVYTPENIGVKDVLIDNKIIKIADNLPEVKEWTWSKAIKEDII